MEVERKENVKNDEIDKNTTRRKCKRARASSSLSSHHHATQRLFSDSSSNDEHFNEEELQEDNMKQKKTKNSKHDHHHSCSANEQKEEENLLPSDNSSSFSENNDKKDDVIDVSSSVSSYLTVSENNTIESFIEDNNNNNREYAKQNEKVFNIDSLETITQDANDNVHDKERLLLINNQETESNQKATTTQDSVQFVAVRTANEVHFAEVFDEAIQRYGFMTMYSNIDHPTWNKLRRCFIIQSFTSAGNARGQNVNQPNKFMVVSAVDPRFVRTSHSQNALLIRNEQNNEKAKRQTPSRIQPSALLQYTCVRTASSSIPTITTKETEKEKAVDHKANQPINNDNINPFQRLASSMRFSAGRSYALQCTLKVLCVEVCVKRTAGMQSLSSGSLYAVALGFTSSTSDEINVKVVCVNNDNSKDSQIKKIANIRDTNKKMKNENVNEYIEYNKKNVNCKMNTQRSYELSDHVVIEEVCDEASLLRCVAKEIMHYDPDLILS